MKKQFCFGFILVQFLLVFRLWAQPAQPFRLELPLLPDQCATHILPQPDSSLVLFIQTYGRRADTYMFRLYNHLLELQWSQEATLPAGSRLAQSHASGSSAYYLFLTNQPDEFYMLQLQRQTGKLSTSRHLLPAPAELGEFKVIGDYAFIVATAPRHETVLHLNLYTGENRFLPALYEEPGALQDMQADTAQQQVWFVLSGSKGNKSRLQVKKFAPDGRYTETYFIQAPEPKSLITGRIAPGSELLAGLYTLRDLRYGQGFFTVKPDSSAPFGFYDFTSFSRFFDYTKPRRQARLLRRLDRYAARNKPYRLRTRFLLHDLRPTKDGYILVGEAYYPQYRSSLYPEFGGRLYNSRVFDGFRYTHAVVCKLNPAGELLWQNSYPLKDVLFYNLRETLQVSISPDETVLAYASGGAIFYKFVRDSTFTEKFLQAQVLPYELTEKVLLTEYAALQRLYGLTFLASGFQKIRSGNGNTRTVFYMNKVEF